LNKETNKPLVHSAKADNTGKLKNGAMIHKVCEFSRQFEILQSPVVAITISPKYIKVQPIGV
jgi:hypothetical protein